MKVKKTFPKILWLIVSSSIFFIILFFALFYYTKKAETKVYNDTVEQFDNEIHKLLVLESKPIFVAINNDTNWDEFVNFITTKDPEWFDETIGNELEIYDAEYLGAYDAKMNFIIRTPTPKIKTLDFIPKNIKEKLNEEGIKKFYLRIPEGVVEVTGAAIHPSDDPLKNKTKTSGYFYVVRLIDAEFLENIKKTTSSTVQFIQENEIVPEEKNKISLIYQLRDADDKVVGTLLFKRNFEIYFENTIKLLYAIIIAFIINLLINLTYARMLVYYPLGLIRRVLQTGNKKAIEVILVIYLKKIISKNLN
jgi:sensor domain CHASE-containing protein